MTVADIVQAERDLGDSLERYAGRWVAVYDYQVVADAETLGELLEQVESESFEEDATVLHIPAEKTAACFF